MLLVRLSADGGPDQPNYGVGERVQGVADGGAPLCGAALLAAWR